MKKLLLIVLGTFAIIGCGGGGTAVTAPVVPRQLAVINYLYTSISINVGGTVLGSVPSGILGAQSQTFVIPGSAASVTYTLTKAQYSDGMPVPDDLTGETLTLPSGDVTLNVNNIIGTQPYYTFILSNTSGVPINVGVVSAGTVRCLGTLQSGASQQYGYYTLTSTSEVHYYGFATNCSGASRFWSTASLNAYQANSGALILNASIAP